MSQAIIRGIWGDGTGHSDNDLERSIREAKKNGDPVDKVYCFGIKNKRLLEKYGYKPDMLDSEPIIKLPKPRKPDRFRLHPHDFGLNTWWHKTKIIEVATQEFDHVLWQDFDVRLQQPLPPDFWDELKSKASFRLPLAVQRTAGKGAWWRMPLSQRKGRLKKQPPQTKVCAIGQAQIVPAGGYMYIRGHSMGQQLLDMHNEHRDWNGQPLFALLIDQLYNGWQGIQSYIDNGHEVEGYFYGASICRPDVQQTFWSFGPHKVFWYCRHTEHFWEFP